VQVAKWFWQNHYRSKSAVLLTLSALCRYALDVNTERAEDVLTHKKLLELAKDPATRPAFFVRAVHVSIPHCTLFGGMSWDCLSFEATPSKVYIL
jgi:hypothetical protein